MTLHRWLVVGVVVGATWAGPASLGARVRAEATSNASDVARAEGFAADACEAYTHKDYSASVALSLLRSIRASTTARMKRLSAMLGTAVSTASRSRIASS